MRNEMKIIKWNIPGSLSERNLVGVYLVGTRHEALRGFGIVKRCQVLISLLSQASYHTSGACFSYLVP